MHSPHPGSFTVNDAVSLLIRYRRRLILATAIGTVLGLAYAALAPEKWEASQALIVREEAYNNVEGPGRFRHADDMKVIQETVLELAKSHSVLKRALRQVGPAKGGDVAGWPTEIAIAELRKRIKLAPPKGAEFGKTEVFYLKVTDENRGRAIKLADSVCDALQLRFQEVLNEKAESMVKELVDSVAQAQSAVQAASDRLGAVERSVGTDLAELRILHASPSTASDLRQKIVFIEGEIRRLRTVERTNQELLKLLEAASQDPKHLIAAPNSLLESQPALRRLKEGLIDAQIKTAQLQGNMTDKHPVVIAAATAEQEIRRDIHNELNLAMRGVNADSRLVGGQLQTLQRQLDEAKARLERVGGLRTEYSNLVAEVDHATKMLQTAEANLADARAKQTGALHASLIGRIDSPDAGIRPIGPGRLTMVLAGSLGGFLSGLGLVLLSAAPRSHRVHDIEAPVIAEPAPSQQASTRPESHPVERPSPPAVVEPVWPKAKPPLPIAEPAPLRTPAVRKKPAARPRPRRNVDPAEQLSLRQALARVSQRSESR